MVTIQNRQLLPVNIMMLEKAAKLALCLLEYERFDLSIVLVTNEDMQQYNKNFREIDKPTDVLSFPFFPDLPVGTRIVPSCADERNLGDLIIAPLYIQQTLEQWQDTFDHRLLVLLVHGICHLLGYDHIQDEDFVLMQAEEKRLLAFIESNMS
jgi:rRNA maturation RNase YbeY